MRNGKGVIALTILSAAIACGTTSYSVLPTLGQTDLSHSGSLPLYRSGEEIKIENSEQGEGNVLGPESPPEETAPTAPIVEEPVLVNVLVLYHENDRGIMYYWGIPRDSIVRGEIGKRSSFLCDGEEVLTTGLVLESRVSYHLSDLESSMQYVNVFQTTYSEDILIGERVSTRMVFDVPGDDTSVFVCLAETAGAETMVVELNEFLITPVGENTEESLLSSNF